MYSVLSVSQLIQIEDVVRYNTNCCKIYNKQNKLVSTDNLVNGVYRLNTIKKKKNVLSASFTVTSETWYHRFGHINSDYLNKMKNGLVDGLSFSGNKKGNLDLTGRKSN